MSIIKQGRVLTPEEAKRYNVTDYLKVGGYMREESNIVIGAGQGESVTVGKYSAAAATADFNRG